MKCIIAALIPFVLVATAALAADNPVSCQGASCKVTINTRTSGNVNNVAATFDGTGPVTLGPSGSTSTNVMNAGKFDVDVTSNNFTNKATTGFRLQTNAGATTVSMALRATDTTVPATTLIMSVPAASDTGAVAVGNFDARRDDGTSITTRPLFAWTKGFSTTLMQMSASGNLGLGTTTPTQGIVGLGTYLDISSSSGGGLTLHNTPIATNGEFSFYKGNNGSYVDSGGASTAAGNNDMIFRVASANSSNSVTERMRINSAGKVTINDTATGVAALGIKSSAATDTAGTTGLFIYNNTTNSGVKLYNRPSQYSVLQSTDFANSINTEGGTRNDTFPLKINPYGGNVEFTTFVSYAETVDNATTGTVTLNAYAPTTPVINFNGSATITLNGIIAPSTPGAVIYVVNNSGNTLTINSESGSATSTNRIQVNGASKTVINSASFTCFYAGSRWRCITSG